MKALILALAAPALALPFAPSTTLPAAPEPLHCQVPCGIYGDTLRIDLLMEDLATIEKAMKSIQEFQAAESPNINQMVRWTVTKDEHAQKIQDQVSAYWMAQRIKFPAADADEAARSNYASQLELMHRATVYAMKCKQTTDTANVEELRRSVLVFSESYFDEADLEHVRSHHGGDHK